MSQKLSSTTFVIFGVSGDLSQRKLLPALGEICRSPDLKTRLKILGLSRRKINAEDVLPGSSKNLARQFRILQMDYDNPDDYRQLKEQLKKTGSEQIIFYFAVPPEAILTIVAFLGNCGMNSSKYRLLMEKPFGTDLASARKLINETDKHFKEEQIYRIDHFLAKEMVQNIAVFLGSNAIFRDVWNKNFIEKIEVVAEESIGIENRKLFYEQTGALRDVIQSHLLQLAALTLMEPCPDVFDFSAMRSHRLAALKSLHVKPSSVIKGQYRGYRHEVGNSRSYVETFVAIELASTNPKWRGVPLRLITGKRMNEKLTEIRIFFKKTQDSQTNSLRLRVQPREGIEIDLWVKKPGYEQELQKLPLDFSYQKYFGRVPDAYEQVIVDAVRGRANLFASSDEILASWKILQPVLNNWSDELITYPPGSTSEEILKKA